MTASMVHVMNLTTPGSECNPLPAGVEGGVHQPRRQGQDQHPFRAPAGDSHAGRAEPRRHLQGGGLYNKLNAVESSSIRAPGFKPLKPYV
jgi:hypothetical protein